MPKKLVQFLLVFQFALIVVLVLRKCALEAQLKIKSEDLVSTTTRIRLATPDHNPNTAQLQHVKYNLRKSSQSRADLPADHGSVKPCDQRYNWSFFNDWRDMRVPVVMGISNVFCSMNLEASTFCEVSFPLCTVFVET